MCLPVDPNLRSKVYDNSPLVVAGFGKTETSMCSACLLFLQSLFLNHIKNIYRYSFYFAGSQSDVKLHVGLNGFNLQQCGNVYKNSKVTLSEVRIDFSRSVFSDFPKGVSLFV